MALGDTFVRQVKHSGKPSGDKYTDGGGMYLLVSAASKYWRMDYRLDGKRRTLALGVCGLLLFVDLLLGLARQRVQERAGADVRLGLRLAHVQRHLPASDAAFRARMRHRMHPLQLSDRQVLVATYVDHLPLYRQENIFARAGHAFARSALAHWVGARGLQLQPLVDALKEEVLRCAVVQADEMPAVMLAPGTGKTHRAYLWAYAGGAFEDLRAVVYDLAASRSGERARKFLGDWQGSLVYDGYRYELLAHSMSAPFRGSLIW